MSVNLPSHYVSQFATNIALLLQQKGSKLRGLVTEGSYVGKQASPVDQVGAINMQPKGARFSPMGRVDAPVDRRWVLPSDWDLPQLIDQFDKLRLLIDPQSSYVQNAVFAAGRKMDDLIIDSFFGTAKTGEEGGTSTSFLTGNVVAINHGAAGNTGLTVAKLREAKRLLMSHEVDFDADTITAIVTSKQHDNLLAEAQIISKDFNERPVLVDGKVTRFMGINIVHCEQLDVDGSSYRRVPIFAKSGMHLGVWKDQITSISKRNDLSGEPWQAYLMMSMGATRLEEKKIIEVKCVE
jgi:hypothetical protein